MVCAGDLLRRSERTRFGELAGSMLCSTIAASMVASGGSESRWSADGGPGAAAAAKIRRRRPLPPLPLLQATHARLQLRDRFGQRERLSWLQIS